MRLFRLAVLLGIAASTVIAEPKPPQNPPAKVAYGDVPLPVTPDDGSALFNKIEQVVAKDEFEKSADRLSRLKGSDLVGRDIRIIIPPEHVAVHPLPDQDFYIVSTADDISPKPGENAFVTVATVIDHRDTVPMQNAMGAKIEVDSISGRKLKLGFLNWSKLGYGLIWQEDPKSMFSPISLGIAFRKPSAELLQLMKNKQLGLLLRFQLTRLEDTVSTSDGFAAKFDSPLSTYFRVLIVPAELKAVAVVSADGKRAFALWSDGTPVATPTSTSGPGTK